MHVWCSYISYHRPYVAIGYLIEHWGDAANVRRPLETDFLFIENYVFYHQLDVNEMSMKCQEVHNESATPLN